MVMFLSTIGSSTRGRPRGLLVAPMSPFFAMKTVPCNSIFNPGVAPWIRKHNPQKSHPILSSKPKGEAFREKWEKKMRRVIRGSNPSTVALNIIAQALQGRHAENGHKTAKRLREIRPRYLYPEGVRPAHFVNISTWRETGEVCAFYERRVRTRYGLAHEKYVLVFRGGTYVEVAQFGVIDVPKRKLMGV